MRLVLCALLLAACGGDDADPAADGGGGGAPDSIGGNGTPYADAQALIEAYHAAHPGQDGDINAKTPDQIAGDADAQTLLGLCGGDDQRPVIPLLAWEYGGTDHAWINPEMSALVYCVYIPVSPSTDHWSYDATAARVTADVYVLYPDENPCNDQAGALKVSGCIGDQTNFEILVDTASLHDGADAGLSLAEASTELMLLLDDGSKVHLITNL